MTVLFLAGCASKEELKDNPFLGEYNTPFDVPPFDKIENKHFMPAFLEAIKQHENEVDLIVSNPEEATFENTVEALEYSGMLLTRVLRVFFNINSANTTDEIQELAQEISPILSEHRDNIMLNPVLFNRIKFVYDNRSTVEQDKEQSKLLEKTYKDFVRGGAGLSEEKRERFREINSELSSLTLTFGQNMLAETNAFQLIVEDEADLAGLPKGLIDAAAEEATKNDQDGKWIFTLHNPSIMPFLQFAENRELREKIKKAYIMRGDNDNENDNKEIIRKIIALRLERAGMLGYDNHAAYVLEENMAKTPENVYALLDQLWDAALPNARYEMMELQAIIEKEGHDFKLEPWDWRYYAELLRREKYDFDDEELKPYFELNKVTDGVFMVVNKLWGLEFKKLEDLPVYHEEAVVYQVLDNDGSHLGILYMDFHPRPGKRGGAWMTSFREQYKENGERVDPIISIVCNFSRPTGEQPALLTIDEVTTYFHEFGHALHGLLSNCNYVNLSGTSVPRDFVELPSQIMENWATEPEVLKMYAKHYQSGEVIPDELIEKLEMSGHFNQGFATVEYLAASYLDMDYHTLQSIPVELNIDEFENSVAERINLMSEIVYRYRSTYFAHIFSGGYSAGYYSYIWAGILDADAFQAFKETGLFDQETAMAYRKFILEPGGTEYPMELYQKFRGGAPSIEPLLRRRGLK